MVKRQTTDLKKMFAISIYDQYTHELLKIRKRQKPILKMDKRLEQAFHKEDI